jgi:hypothetical protein
MHGRHFSVPLGGTTRYYLQMRFVLLAILLSTTPALAREAPEWTYCDFGVDPKAGIRASKNWLEAGQERGIA